MNLVFTTPIGGLVLRQTIAKVVKQAAKTAGIPAQRRTHAGGRTVVTTLLVDGGEGSRSGRPPRDGCGRPWTGAEALEDIARFVGHNAKPATTAGHVKRLGRRSEAVAKRAAFVLDGQAGADDAHRHVSESPRDFRSNGGSNGTESPGSPANDAGPSGSGIR